LKVTFWQLCKFLSFVVIGGYVPFLLLTYVIEPETSVIDIFPTQERGDESSIGYYGYRLQNSDKPKIALLGASNMMHGFRPLEFQKEFPNYQAGNFAVSAINISGIQEMLMGLEATIPRPLLSKSYFVVGLFFPNFNTNKERYGRFRKDKLEKSDCLEEIVKFGFFEFVGQSIKPRFSPFVWTVLASLERPFRIYSDSLHLDAAFYEGQMEFINKLTSPIPPAEESVVTLPNSGRLPEDYLEPLTPTQQFAVDFWPKFMNRPDFTLSDEQFIEFVKLCRYANEHQLRLVIVDLPIAHWHLRSRLYKDYQQRKVAFFKEALHSPYVTYINMQDLTNNEYFSDSVHPNAAHSALWAKTIHDRWPGYSSYH
jgi:hypothetical protein